MRRRLALLGVLVALALAAMLLRSGRVAYCPGDPCAWAWLSAYCAYLCPYDDQGPVIEIPVRAPR